METTVHGYRVILYVTEVEEVKVESVVNAGFLHETKETSGVNHLLEHVLTSAWAKCAPNCSEYFSDKGITMNASTELDFMTYHVTGLPKEMGKMIDYICQISDHPIMHQKTLTDEKEAVKDEMLAYGAEMVSSLTNKFNYAFYQNGMQYKDDWRLQIANLKNLTLSDLKRVFREEFNTGNVTFMVSGKFDKMAAIKAFHKGLRDRPKTEFLPFECFTYYHGVVFDKAEVPTYTLMVGFPSKNKDEIMATAVCDILKNVLFEELRTRLKLIYTLHVEKAVMPCGTQCIFEMTVQAERMPEVIRVLFKTLNKYKKEHFSKKNIYAMKTHMQRLLNATLPTLDILEIQIAAHPESNIVLREEAFQRIRRATPTMLQEMVKVLFVEEHSLIAYQGKTEINLSPTVKTTKASNLKLKVLKTLKKK